MKNSSRTWVAKTPNNFGKNIPAVSNITKKSVPEEYITPLDFFKIFVTDEFIDKITASSINYANKKNRPEVAAKLTSSTMRVSHAVMFMTGYITPSNRRIYWENREDRMNLLAKKAINRDDFVDILQHTHFADQGAADPDDRYWKVRPLFDVLNTTRIRKWYWCIYTWFLNVSMVQAWRLYRQVLKNRYQQEREKEDQKQLDKEQELLKSHSKVEVNKIRKEWETEQKKIRGEQKKLEEIPQLEFIRQIVEFIVMNYGKGKDVKTSGRLSATSKGEVRYDGRGHLVKMSVRKGVCQLCKKRTFWRCVRCDVALHCECFYNYHVKEEEQ